MISLKGSNLSKSLLLLLNNFEETLGGRLRKLNPKDKVKNSTKGKILMRAMYGVKVETVFICSVFASAFSGSTRKLFDLNVDDKYMWAQALTDLQTSINSEIRNLYSTGRFIVSKELEAVYTSVKKLYRMIQDGVDPIEVEAFQNSVSVLARRAEGLSQGLDLLTNQYDRFFHVVLTGRDALLYNVRESGTVSDPKLGCKVVERVQS